MQYDTEALLTLQDQRRVVFGRTANLSPSGVFVLSPKVYRVGTPLRCTIMLLRKKLTLRGRVARVIETEPSGMGIAFTNLSEDHRSLLHEATSIRPQLSPQLASYRQPRPSRLKEPLGAPDFTDEEATLIVDPLLGSGDARVWNWALALVTSGFLITLAAYLFL